MVKHGFLELSGRQRKRVEGLRFRNNYETQQCFQKLEKISLIHPKRGHTI